MGIAEQITIAVSVCADCFAVALCSSVTLKQINWKSALKVALIFAAIQTGFLIVGSLIGGIFTSLAETITKICGFALLSFVGGSMIYEGIKNDSSPKNLDSTKNIILSGIATSFDALAIGAAQGIGMGTREAYSWVLPVAVFIFTFVCVVVGIIGGKVIGSKCGRWAEIIGGGVLVAMGLSILL